jgi:hypothetical protein
MVEVKLVNPRGKWLELSEEKNFSVSAAIMKNEVVCFEVLEGSYNGNRFHGLFFNF